VLGFYFNSHRPANSLCSTAYYSFSSNQQLVNGKRIYLLEPLLPIVD